MHKEDLGDYTFAQFSIDFTTFQIYRQERYYCFCLKTSPPEHLYVRSYYHYTQKHDRITSKTISVPQFLHPNYRIQFPKQFGKGFGNSLFKLLTETYEFQKHIGSEITLLFVFLDFLVFVIARYFLDFLSVFPLRENPCFFFGRAGITENNSKMIKFFSVSFLCEMISTKYYSVTGVGEEALITTGALVQGRRKACLHNLLLSKMGD